MYIYVRVYPFSFLHHDGYSCKRPVYSLSLPPLPDTDFLDTGDAELRRKITSYRALKSIKNVTYTRFNLIILCKKYTYRADPLGLRLREPLFDLERDRDLLPLLDLDLDLETDFDLDRDLLLD